VELALRGILIGLSLGAPIGPINIEILRRGLRSGFLAGWLVGIGAVTGDTLYCLLTIAGLTPVVDHRIVRIALLAAGGLFLIYMGFMCLRSARSHVTISSSSGTSGERRSYLTGFLMALLNPYGIVFWLSLGGALVASGIENTGRLGTVSLVIGVIAGIVLWITTLSLLVKGGRRFVTDRVFRLVNLTSGLLLIVFGAGFVMQMINQWR
jgi:threonine/homoserine/homoserine lactone efflux protein